MSKDGTSYARAKTLLERGLKDRDPVALSMALSTFCELAEKDLGGSDTYAEELGAAYFHLYEYIGRIEDLRHAIEAFRSIIVAVPGRPRDLSNLGLALTRWFEHTREAAALDEGLAVLRQAAALLARGRSTSIHSNLGLALTRWMEYHHDLDPLDEAVTAHRNALDAVRTLPATMAAFHCNLANTWLVAYGESNRRDYLSLAVAEFRRAVSVVPAEHPHVAGCQAGLGQALVKLSAATGDVKLLLEGIRYLRRVVDRLPAGDPDRLIYLNQLTNALRSSFTLTGDTAALEEAIVQGRKACAAVSPDNGSWAIHHSSLATALQNRFGHSRDPASVREAVQILRLVVEATATTDPDRVIRTSHLGNALHRLGAHERALPLLAESITLLRAAADSTAHEHPDRLLYLSNLGAALLTQAEVSGEDQALADAVATLEAACPTDPDGSVPQAGCLLALGHAYREQFRRTGDPTAHTRCISAYSRLLETATAPTLIRATAGQELGHRLFDAGDYRGALTAFTQTVELLDLVAWLGLERDDQERLLRGFPLLAGTAAACAIELGDLDRAVEVLEQGRGILLAQTLNTRRAHRQLDLLRPDLAARLESVHHMLEETALHASESPLRDSGTDADSQRRRRQQLAVERDTVLTEIRSQPGLQGFLRAPAISDLLQRMPAGPIVILNTSSHRCDALVLTAEGVSLVPLDLTFAGIASRATALAAALRNPGWETSRTLLRVLEWLWEYIVGPVLQHLELPPSDTPPPVWWMPTGLLALLPLHAAGRYYLSTEPRLSALDLVSSSYTSTMRTMGSPGHSPPVGLAPLAVAVSAPGTDHLEYAVEEAQLVAGHLGADTVAVYEYEATRDRVRADLARSSWIHFACHAAADPNRPSDSRLLLYDGPLRVRDVAAIKSADGGGAYLAACETALGSRDLPDETIHIAAAFQLAGFSTVIGTMWRISDYVSPQIADILYTAMANGSPPALALNIAARQIRDRYPRNPVLWASHLHFGA